jgi:hypothetical protein
MDIIHHPVSYLNRDVSETGFCVLTHLELTQLVLLDGATF